MKDTQMQVRNVSIMQPQYYVMKKDFVHEAVTHKNQNDILAPVCISLKWIL